MLLVLRIAISSIRSGPVLVADEIGYLTNARVLVGGLPGQLELAPVYKGGYSLAIAPIVGLVSDPTVSYHLVLVLDAALLAAVFPLLYLLLTRFLGMAPGVAIWAAFTGALYPAVTVLSGVAMSESLLFPLVCIWLIAWGGLLSPDRPGGLGWAALLGASTAILWIVHGRMVVAVLLTFALLAWLALRRRLDLRGVLVALGAAVAGIVAMHFLDAFLIDHNYGGRTTSETGDRLGDLFSTHGLLTVVANLVGQAWYLVVATFGLVALLAANALTAARHARGRAGAPHVATILLGLTVLLLLISAAAFPERTRPDMLIYGRYVEIVAPPLIAIGVATLATGRRLLVPARQALLGFGLLTGLVVLIRITAEDPGAVNRWNISSLPFLTFELGPTVLLGAAVVAATGAAMLLWTARRRPAAVAFVAIALFLAVTAYGVWNPVRSSQRAAYPDGWTSPQPVAAGYGIDTVGYDADSYDVLGLYPPQWFLPDTRFEIFHGERQRPPTRFVLASSSWNREHPDDPGREIWRDVGRDQVLWRLDRPGE